MPITMVGCPLQQLERKQICICSELQTMEQLLKPKLRRSHPTFFSRRVFHQDGYLIGVGRYWAATLPKKSASAHRIQLVNGNWTLTDTFTFAEKLATTTENLYGVALIRYSKAAFQLTGNFFVAADATKAYIYELSTNQTSWTWSIKQSFGLFLSASYTVDSLAWNGNDAIMGGYAFANAMVMQIKSNGTWTSQGRTGGIDGSSYLGYTSLSLNEDTFLVSSIFTKQQVAIIQRQNGEWWLTGVIVPANTSQTFFGASLAVTDQHLLIDGQNDLYAVPLCIFDPIDYDCPSIVELESCDFGEFKAEVACTTKATPECSFPVTTTVNDQVIFSNNTIYVSFQMQRFGAVPRQATVGLRCGLSSSPSTGPSSSPSSSPSSANNSPITINTPASAPRNSDSVTSGSENNRASYLFVFLTFLLFLSC